MGIQEIRIELNNAANQKRDFIANIVKAKKLGKPTGALMAGLREWDALYKKCRRMLKTTRRTSKYEAI